MPALSNPIQPPRLRNRFLSQPIARRAYRVIQILAVIALLSDFLANDKPLYCKIEGTSYFPVFQQYAVQLGLSTWDAQFVTKRWSEQNYDWAIWPPIPYAAHTIDLKNGRFTSPLAPQRVEKLSRRHWLGTDQLGRDLAAGLIAGTRTALLVGLVAMAIAGTIGILLGTAAGYFGNNNLHTHPFIGFFGLAGLGWIWYYWMVSRSYGLLEGRWLQQVTMAILYSMLFALALSRLNRLLQRNGALRTTIRIPLDDIILRIIEIVSALPGLMLILAITALIKNPGIYDIMLIIGLISWTGIARFARAEMIRIRSLEYLQAARVLGYGHWRIIRRHALPNILTPLLISLAFGMSGAVLLEAFLSFLGLGLDAEATSWGSLLNMAKSNISAWWMAVFPGLAIFVLVLSFNLVGEGLSNAIERTNP
jgi:peptide/nickel transport system permease protein